MTEEVKPDPGNSAPEAWTEPLSAEEREEARKALADHAAAEGETDDKEAESDA